MKLDEFYSRHERVALMFSGGRDSIACLHLIEPFLNRTLVIWVNTGSAFPEIVEFMDGVKHLVPNFLELQTNQPNSILENGYPVDVLPINYSHIGQACTHEKPIKLRSYNDCCAENFWIPAEHAIRELGITGVIRGQRNSEDHHGPVPSGTLWEGVEYCFPIESWSENELLQYLSGNNVVLDERLSMSHSSLDCWNCTAFCASSIDRTKYVKKHHPEKFEQVVKIMKQIDNAISTEMDGLRKILEI
jgi:3'-phosphoadenosine 5'-phosphosulfate sulfotransferase (PAPS reductase)/FAD synthetase